MQLTPDNHVIWAGLGVVINLTMIYTWLIILLLAGGAWWFAKRLRQEPPLPAWQYLLETIILSMKDQIEAISEQSAQPYLALIGSLFIFIFTSSVLAIIPGFIPPTSSLSTTTALALCVFFAVPYYAIRARGWRGYLRYYLQPSVFMLPFNIIGDFSRTLALAVRLYGNAMSSITIAAILLTIMPLFIPIIMDTFGLVTGVIQAYIFAVLAMVYITSAVQSDSTDQK